MSSGEEKQIPIRDFVSAEEAALYGGCYACGPRNSEGLRLEFYMSGDNKEKVEAIFTPRDNLQGWPEALHGGIVATLLDEAAAYVAYVQNVHAVTARLNVKLKKPVSLSEPVKVIGSLQSRKRKIMDVETQLVSLEGDELAIASVTLMILPEHQKVQYGIANNNN